MALMEGESSPWSVQMLMILSRSSSEGLAPGYLLIVALMHMLMCILLACTAAIITETSGGQHSPKTGHA